MRSGIFSPRNLDDPNHVEMAGEIGFYAQWVLRRLDERCRVGKAKRAHQSTVDVN
jgi:hypothetical protein